MRQSVLFTITSTLAGFVTATSASAAVVTERFTFNVTGIASVDGPPSPVTSASGQFTITYDNAVFVMDATTVSFNTVTPAYLLSIPVSYTFSPSLNGTLNFGGAEEGTNGLMEGTDDFLLQIETVRTTPKFGMFDLTKQGYSGMAQSLTGTVTREVITPEPASVSVLIAALAATVRRRSCVK